MSSYALHVTPQARNDIKTLPGHMRQRIRRAIGALPETPRPLQSKALHVPDLPWELRRLRIDRYRIFYVISEVDHTVDILAVRKRPPYDYGDLVNLLESLAL